jgi:hypothetical protein
MAHPTQWLLLSASSVPCSVYRSFADFEWAALWKSKVEFFCWLILQNKLWTADRITKYGGTTNTVCQLCLTKNESALHMMAKCSYSKTIWTALASWIGTHFRPPPRRNYRRLQTWWRNLLRRGGPNAVERRDRMQKVIYTAWNIWRQLWRLYSVKFISEVNGSISKQRIKTNSSENRGKIHGREKNNAGHD